MTLTGLFSLNQSSRHSGNSVLCQRSEPSMKRLIRSSRKSHENPTARIKSSDAFLHSLGQKWNSLYVLVMSALSPIADSSRTSRDVRYVPIPEVARLLDHPRRHPRVEPAAHLPTNKDRYRLRIGL